MSTLDDESELTLFGEDNFILPAWAVQLIDNHALHMRKISCPFCSEPILVDECKPIYEYYSISLIHGVDDLMLAIVLNKGLTRVAWNESLRQASLKTVMVVNDIEEFYLQWHECGKTPVGSMPDDYAFPTSTRIPVSDWYEGAEPTETEIQDFTEAWS
ncbi:hypothetical protein [Alloscardovia omnicolens]